MALQEIIPGGMLRVDVDDEAQVAEAMRVIYDSAGLQKYLPDHLQKVLDGRASLWVVPSFGFAVVSRGDDNLHVLMTHGRHIYAWARPLLIQLAQLEGCRTVSAMALTPGIARALRRLGFVAGGGECLTLEVPGV